MHYFIEALKSGDPAAIVTAEDLSPLTIKELVERAVQRRKDNARAYLNALAPLAGGKSVSKPKPNKKPDAEPSQTPLKRSGLLAVLEVPVNERAAKLKELGFRRDALEFFPT